MNFSHVNGPWNSEPVEKNYGNTFQIPDDKWDSIIGLDRSDATQYQSPPVYRTAALGSTESYSSIGGNTSPMHTPSGSRSTGARSSYLAIVSPQAFINFDTPFPYSQDDMNEPCLYSTSGGTRSCKSSGAVRTEPAGYKSDSDGTLQPDRSENVRPDQEQLLQASSPETDSSRNDAYHAALPFSLDGSSLHPHTSDALTVNRGLITSDELAKLYFYSIEGHRQVQHRSGMDVDGCEGAPVEPPSGKSPVWQGRHQLRVCSVSGPMHPPSPSGKGSSPTSPSAILSTLATKTLSNDDSWKCDSCGRVLATKGTKNRNRNKRRHKCPGTGPKYPCAICSRLFNRGDTRLLHLRKQHPEVHTDPPRPRKRKDL